MSQELKVVHPQNRLRGTLPKVGIRPTIDGRRKGIRESLEVQTMNMARSAAKLIEAKLRYACGIPVECVIADTCIGGFAEAAAAAEKFAREGVGVSLTVTPCWCYGGETMDMDPHMPKAVWGFNGTERPGAVYLAAVLSGHAQKGLPAFGIYGQDVQDSTDTSIPADVEAKLLRFVRAGIAVAELKNKAYLAMGGTSMGIAGSMVDVDFFEDYLGMRVESVDMTEFIRRIDEGIYDPEEYELALAWVRENCQVGGDTNPVDGQKSQAEKDEDWKTVVKMAIIGRDLMVGNPRLDDLGFGEEALGHNAIASGFQGQRHWTDHYPNGDFLETVLCSSFDWNGIRQPYICATENDSLNGVAMLFGHLVTGSAQIFSDVRTYWSPAAVERITGKKLTGRASDGIIHLINSGSTCLDGTGKQTKDGMPVIKPWWEVDSAEAHACLASTRFWPANSGYFRGGGFSTEFCTEGGMPVTMSRVSIVKGLGPILQIAEGYTVELPDDVNDALVKRTDPTWPTTWFAPTLNGEGAFTSVYSVMSNWSANHGAISYGHIGADLIALAAMLRIPVAMHNVPEERIFRPSVWGLFGTHDSEGSDYRACQSFGPLYGKTAR